MSFDDTHLHSLQGVSFTYNDKKWGFYTEKWTKTFKIVGKYTRSIHETISFLNIYCVPIYR